MQYLGTSPEPCPHDPTLVRCRIRNRHMSWVYFDLQYADAVRPFDIYIDKADQVHLQSITGKRKPLRDITPYAVRTILTPETRKAAP